MLYLIYGEDSYRARGKVNEIAGNLAHRDPSSLVYRFDAQKADEEKLINSISGQNIFGQKSIVIFDGLLVPTKTGVDPEFADLLITKIKTMSESRNVYIFLEKKLNLRIVKKIFGYAQKTSKFDGLSAEKIKNWIVVESRKHGVTLTAGEVRFLSESFGDNLWAVSSAIELKILGGDIDIKNFLYNPFGLTDVFSRKNKRGAYKCFHENLAGGVSAEEMFWRLWWQVKNMLAVNFYKKMGLNNSQIRQKTALNPFVIQKNTDALTRFTSDELERVWDDLFLLWRNSKSGKVDMSLGIEKILLNG